MRIALAVAFSLLAWLPARADLYDWTDQDGVEHFSSSPPPAGTHPKGRVKRQKTRPAPSPESPQQSPNAAAPPADAKPAPKIVLYTTSWCPVCKAARAYLNARGLAYKDFDVEADPAAAAQFRAYGGQGVPLALIDGSLITGFTAAAYDQRLPR